MTCSLPTEALDAPKTLSLDGVSWSVEDVTEKHPHDIKRGEAALAGAWWRLAWLAACREVHRRWTSFYLIRAYTQPLGSAEWTHDQLYKDLHTIHAHPNAELEEKL